MAHDEIFVAFCQIDAKDDSYCGYSPCAFSTKKGPVLLGKENGKLAMLMEQEYLTRVALLQEEIAKIYMPLFDFSELPTKDAYGRTRPEYRGRIPGL